MSNTNSRVDQLDAVVATGIEIERIVLDNGWKYFEVDSVEPAAKDHEYMVRYHYDGYPRIAVVDGRDVRFLTERDEEETE